MGNLPAVKSWVFYVMPDLYSGLWLFWLPGKHRRWIVSQFLGCRMSKCTIIHDGLCLKWTSLHHLFPMATLDGFTKDLPSWREGSRTIIQNDDNHANQIQSFLRAVPKCWACLETRHRWKWSCWDWTKRARERETFKSSLLSHLVTPARSLHEPVVIVGLSSEAEKLLDLVVLLCCTESRLLLFFFELAANCCFLLFKNTQRWVTQTLARSLFFLQISARLLLLLSS